MQQVVRLRPYLNVQVISCLEVHDVNVEVVLVALRQQLAQQEYLSWSIQHGRGIGAAVLELRLSLQGKPAST